MSGRHQAIGGKSLLNGSIKRWFAGYSAGNGWTQAARSLPNASHDGMQAAGCFHPTNE
jgi:hypothetical protein